MKTQKRQLPLQPESESANSALHIVITVMLCASIIDTTVYYLILSCRQQLYLSVGEIHLTYIVNIIDIK